jgi:cytochrome c oxidase subunit 1/cytochrome c oxidase subunit I+III
VPYVTSRYPLWEEPEFLTRLDEGRFYIPDAPEGKRETIVTSAVDAVPQAAVSITGPTWSTLWAAGFTGGAFILPVFQFYWAAVVSGLFAMACVIYWLWTATAQVPKTPMRDAGLGLKLPTYVSGPNAPGWWGVFITMLGDATAFASLVFGVFFFWTARPDFPPPGAPLPDALWAALAAVCFALAWAATVAARHVNRRGRARRARGLIGAGVVLACGAGGALWLSVLVPGLEPVSHAFPAVMFALVVWTGAHAALGAVMLLYCLAGSWFGKLTPRYDADLRNTTLFWHFLTLSGIITALLLGGFPRLLS